MMRETIKRLQAREITARALTEEALARAEAHTSLGAFLTVCADRALAAAEQADRRLEQGEAPLLCGLPMSLKDSLCTSGIRTSCASRMLADFTPAYSAHVWEVLEGAGAVLIGKNNMDEFAMGAGSETSALGVCRNPADPSRVPGGSSGGSAAAVAAGDVFYALGSDTGGSVRVPAAYCGVVGMRPSYGRISRRGLIAFAPSLDQVGILTRRVWDNIAVFRAISVPDRGDGTMCTEPLPAWEENASVQGLRVGVLEQGPDECSEAVRAMYAETVSRIRERGMIPIPISMPDSEEAYAAYYLISASEASSSLARYDGIRFGARAEGAESVQEMMEGARSAFGEEVRRRLLAGTYALSLGGRVGTYERATAARAEITRRMRELLTQCDVIVTPTVPDGAYKLGERADSAVPYKSCDAFTTASSLAGLPAISIPAQTGDGLPLGIQVIARPFAEETMYRVAAALEVPYDRI